MKKALLAPASLCFALLAALTGCGGGAASTNTSGAGGTSGGGTTGTGGATGPNSLLDGQYAFSFTGSATATGDPLVLAGSFTADGAGNIKTGIEDINEITATGADVSKGLAVAGTYSIGSDGRGTLNFTLNSSIYQTFKIAVETGNHGQLIRFDSGASGSGTFDLQTSSAFSLSSLSGSFAFEWNGSDLSGYPFSGIGAVTLTTNGSATGAADVNDGGTYVQDTVSVQLQPPDGNGHGTASVTYSSSPTPATYSYDIVSSGRILLIETDTNAGTVGEADLQTGSFTTSSLSGNYTFFLNGISQGLAIVGQIVASGGTIMSSEAEQSSVGLGTFPGTYSIAPTVLSATVNGRFLMTATEPSAIVDNFVLYMISPGQAMVMEIDSTQLTFGEMLAQTGTFSSSSLDGNYGINFSGIDSSDVESDFMGQFTSSGLSTLTGGTIDINDEDLATPTLPNNAISGGAYTVINNNTGHGTISFTVDGALLAFNFYFVSPNEIFLIETDGLFLSLGSALSQPTIP